MPISQDQFQQARTLLQSAKNILIISHKNPDGDTIGANLALKIALEQQWGQHVQPACVDPLPTNMQFLPQAESYVRDFDLSNFDLVIAVDAGADYMLKFGEKKPELFDKNKTQMINIDHHASNNGYGTVNLVDANSAATVLIIWNFFKYCDIAITPAIATCLLNGLYYDTGSFMHSNTTPEVYEMAADMLKKGADFRKIVKYQFKTVPVRQMKLWGRVMSRARFNEQGAIVSAVTESDMRECDAQGEDLTGVIDFLNAVPNAKFSMLLSEDMQGNVKGSFRTQDEHIDLSELAATFGGGGHKKAAGFTVPGHIKEKVVWEISQ